ncbi:zinc metalloprotease [Chitinophaga vietnamensis]|uniref:hypothetical protein n=1 Tax=Chitinophaga vietnamensis TaxID=2593957 RepID=UPI001178A5FB|nr:hypothetical protein [Chitinophaga vietnamensis]
MKVVIILLILGLIVIFIIWLFSAGPVVAGACGLVRRTIRKDYCSGSCVPGAFCIVTATRSWAIFGTQAAACKCAFIIMPDGSLYEGGGLPPGSGIEEGAIPHGADVIYIDSGHCLELCLSIKVATDAQGNPVIDDNRVKRVIDGINKIWGCGGTGQCCLRFTISEIKHIQMKNFIDPYANNKADLEDTLKLSRSQTCYNLYFVDNMLAGTPGITQFGSNNDGSLVRTNGYPNDDTLITIGAHELGHALGLARDTNGTDDVGVVHHSNHPKNLMGPVANLQVELNRMQCQKARTSQLLNDTNTPCTEQAQEK